MYRWIAVIASSLGVCAGAQSVAIIPFESVPDPVHLPKDMYFGEVTGVAVNSKGHVFVFSRGNTTGPAYAAAAAQLLEFGADGKFIREIACPNEHTIYVAELLNWRVQKLLLK